MRLQRHLLHFVVNFRFHLGRHDMARAASGVFRLVIVEGEIGDDLGHAERHVAHHRAGEFAAGDVALDHQGLAALPFGAEDFLRRMRLVGLDDEHADRRAVGHGLDHIRRRHDVGAPDLGPRGDDMIGHRDAGGLEDDLGLMLVHRQRRGQHARMRVGDAQEFEQALDGAVLAISPVQRIEPRFPGSPRAAARRCRSRRRSRSHCSRHCAAPRCTRGRS